MEFIKYFFVSLVALVIDYGTYWFLIKETPLSLPNSAVIGYSVGLVVAYGLMAGRIFKNGWLKNRKKIEFIMFLASGAIGMACTYGVVKLTVNLIGERPGIAKGCAIIVSFVVVYLYRKNIVFRAREENVL